MTTETAPSVSAIDKIAPALAKAQAEFTNPPKTKTANAGKYKYQYADLADILDHVRPVLGKYGLAVVQLTLCEPGRNVLVTRLIHESGQFLESSYPLPAQAAAQEMGSAITYARRYSLSAILGIAAEVDDDGEKAGGIGGGGQRDQLVNLMGEAGVGNKAVMDYCRAHGLGDGRTTEDLPPESVERLVSTWAEVVHGIKAPAKPAPVTTSPKSTAVAVAPAGPDLSGLDPKLAELMAAAKVTKEQLKKYYQGAKHLPATVEPEKLPASYLKALLQPANWTKAVESMTALV